LADDRETPVGFVAIRLDFELETNASPEDLATLPHLSERYGVVLHNAAELPGDYGANRLSVFETLG
jgi:hypothetical protein